jgi:molybdopterin-guanine dinucleotide biosynthesis protein A
MNAVVLGGGKSNDPVALAAGVEVKALVLLEGRTMAWHVLRALRESGKVDHIVYVGPVVPDFESLIDTHVPGHDGMLENLEAGLKALEVLRADGAGHASAGHALADRALVVTADVPLLTAIAVRDLFARDPGSALVYPVVTERACESQFPGGRRTYARVREGKFTGGNLFLVEPGLVSKFMPKLRQVIANRKNPLVLAGIIGPGILIKFLLGRVRIVELEARVSQILGVQAKALISEHAEIGFDVDKADDLEIVRQRLERRRAPNTGNSGSGTGNSGTGNSGTGNSGTGSPAVGGEA